MDQTLNLEEIALGIELGSTRIKAVLIDSEYKSIASGEFEWENKLEGGLWTYHLEDVWKGLQAAYRQLFTEVKEKYGISLSKVGVLGISGMMHGYMPFDSKGNQLTAFRTWRNTNTGKAAKELTSLFQFNLPLRWSVAHLYQAMLDKETHVKEIDFLTTLSGYVHWKLTGEKVLGIGEASGMFPIDSRSSSFNSSMTNTFNHLTRQLGYHLELESILPKIKRAGAHAGVLTKEGANLIDPTGTLQGGIPVCPPEGDAGTGMIATNSIAEHTGNVSAGTSIFSMIVLEKDLSNYYEEIDIVTTPTGKPVAMVHCNNFTSDINAWAGLFAELLKSFEINIEMDELFTFLFEQAINAEADGGKLVNCNYFSGEPITGFDEGRPLLVRMPDSNLTVPNFMQSQIYSALATLEIGMELLTKKEKVRVDYILGHGGFFKTEKVGQQLMANALKVPVSVMNTAGEGGPWGMALLAAYAINNNEVLTLENFLEEEVFKKVDVETITPSKEGVDSFNQYMKRYENMLKIEQTAVEALN